MSFRWTEDLGTGIEEVDLQHKAVITQFNDLITACRQQKGGEKVREFLQFLTGYVIVHFSDEERLMREREYPGREAHMSEHREFRERLAKLRDSYIAGGADKLLLDAVWLAAEWFIGHIRRTDMAMAAFLRKTASP